MHCHGDSSSNMTQQRLDEEATAPTCVLAHKRSRSEAFGAVSGPGAMSATGDDVVDEETESGSTSGESSSDESESSSLEEELEAAEDEVEVAAMATAKRQRRAELDELKWSVRRMEAQVGDASAQLRDLCALVAQVAKARRRGLA